jgi:predicted GH43/DUF377 family glycosyl hydrolase
MASSSDLNKWEVSDLQIGTNANSSFIVRFGGIWYVYFSEGKNIFVCISDKIDSGYSDPILILSVGERDAWDSLEISGPNVIWKDGRYYLFYAGEDKDRTKTVGYAVSISSSGPFIKNVNNPVLIGSELIVWKWNSGQDKAMDPSVFQIDEGYIVQHTACRISNYGWSIGWAFTKDFVTFKVMEFPVLTSGSWARDSVSGGGIIQIGDKYYMSFVGYDSGTMKYGKCGLVEIKNFEELKKKIIL